MISAPAPAGSRRDRPEAELVLADAGYWHQLQTERLVSDGMAVVWMIA